MSTGDPKPPLWWPVEPTAETLDLIRRAFQGRQRVTRRAAGWSRERRADWLRSLGIAASEDVLDLAEAVNADR